jgi:monoterpene epsilon-lactone hydrolase
MSLRAELLRLGTRRFIKRRSAGKTIEQLRRGLAAAERLIPRAPVSTRTAKVDAGGVEGQRIFTPASDRSRHLLHLHGGGYVSGSAAYYRDLTWRLATAARAFVLAVDYRLAPEHPFPAALHDAVAAYRWLLAGGADPSRIAVVGDSAGGGLALALVLKLRDDGLPLPAAIVALSPWTDLALTGLSLKRNAAADPMLNAADAARFADYYLAGADPRTPYASPLHGDLAALPPTLIQVGSDEILHDDAVGVADKLRGAGRHVELEVWPRMPHVWHLFAPFVPEARYAIARIGEFVRSRLAP